MRKKEKIARIKEVAEHLDKANNLLFDLVQDLEDETRIDNDFEILEELGETINSALSDLIFIKQKNEVNL